MRLATYNVNSVRARLPRLLDWLESASPDVVALQETKVEDDKFPREAIESMGYELVIHGMKQRQGVAFLTKIPATNVVNGYLEGWPEDCRVQRATFNGVTVVNTYVPNGTEVGSDKWDYKMRWLEAFPSYLASFSTVSDPVVWLGDINVAPTEIDVHDHKRLLGQVGHHPEEFVRLDKITEIGLTECFREQHPEPGHYTFFDFRVPKVLERNLGWRIDHIYVTPPLQSKSKNCWIDRDARDGEKPSDHAPVLCDIEL